MISDQTKRELNRLTHWLPDKGLGDLVQDLQNSTENVQPTLETILATGEMFVVKDAGEIPSISFTVSNQSADSPFGAAAKAFGANVSDGDLAVGAYGYLITDPEDPAYGAGAFVFACGDQNISMSIAPNGDVEFSAESANFAGAFASGNGVGAGSGTTNVDSITDIVQIYSRSGNAVNFGFWFTLDPTAAGNAIVELTPPIASNFAEAYDCIGTVTTHTGLGGQVYASASNNTIVAILPAPNGNVLSCFVSGTYLVK